MMEIISLEESALYKRTEGRQKVSQENEALLSRHQNAFEPLGMGPKYTPQSKPMESKMDSATELSRIKRGGI